MSIPIWIPQIMLALMILVTWHELGHFLPAKWFKTRVERFVIFFDPWVTPIEKKIGETVYGLGWLPLGGYVKISGMIDESMDKEFMKKEPEPWEFRSKTAWQRFVIMIGGIFMNVILAFFLFGIAFWMYGKAYVPIENAKYGMHVAPVMEKYGFQEGDLLVKIGNEKQERFEPSAFMKAVILDDEKKVTVLRDGQEVVLTMPENIGKELARADVNKKSLFDIRFPFVVDSVLMDQPAGKAGLQAGDRMLRLGGEPAMFYNDFTRATQKFKGQKQALEIIRGADTLTLNIQPTESGKVGVYAKTTDNFIPFRKETYPFFKSMKMGYDASWAFLGLQVQAFGKMFKGEIEAKENLGSIISMGKMYGNEWNWERFWTLTASLSMLLAFINLLPIPGLDGGYVLFLLWEMVTGKKVSDNFMEKAVSVGFFILLGLMIYALGLDIWRNFIR